MLYLMSWMMYLVHHTLSIWLRTMTLFSFTVIIQRSPWRKLKCLSLCLNRYHWRHLAHEKKKVTLITQPKPSTAKILFYYMTFPFPRHLRYLLKKETKQQNIHPKTKTTTSQKKNKKTIHTQPQFGGRLCKSWVKINSNWKKKFKLILNFFWENTWKCVIWKMQEAFCNQYTERKIPYLYRPTTAFHYFHFFYWFLG